MEVWGRIIQGRDKVKAARFIEATYAKYSKRRYYQDEINYYDGYCGFYLLQKQLTNRVELRLANKTLKEVPGFFLLPASYWTHHYLGLEDKVLKIPFQKFLNVLEPQINRLVNPDSITGIGTIAFIRPMADARFLQLALKRLLELSLNENGTIYWKADPQFIKVNAELRESEMDEEFMVDLGISHGQSGVICFLSWIILSNAINDQKALSKIKKVLKSALNIFPDNPSNIPAFYIGDAERNKHFPGWCYGNIGMGFAHLLASKALGDKEVEIKGLSILQSFASDELVINQQVNTFLCHGTSGVAHTLARASELVESKELFELSRDWYSMVLKDCVNEISHDKGLMNSSIGTALSLLSASENVLPEWDRFMLLSSPYV